MGTVGPVTAHLFGYARVSTADQDTEAQVRALLAQGVPAENIHTEKLSGVLRGAERPELAAVMSRLRSGDTLWIYALSRLSRNLRDAVNLIYGLVDRGVRVQSISEGLDTDNKITGPVIIALFSSLAEMERTQMLDRQAARREVMLSQGKPFGRPHAIPSATVRSAIVSAYLDGKSPVELAAEFKIHKATVYRYIRAADRTIDS